MKQPKAPPVDLKSPQAIIRALNYHGAFLKKHVLKIIQAANLGLFGEEIPTAFGEHVRAADLIVKDVRPSPRGPELPFFVIECKRVSPEKQWVFLQDRDELYRVSRQHDLRFQIYGSVMARNPDHGLPVCSDGYQYDSSPDEQGRKIKRADPEAIYEATKQISACVLGFAEGRIRAAERVNVDRRPPTSETYVPVLVTNAKLSYIKLDEIDFDTKTAELSKIPAVNPVPFLVYNFPFASPVGHDDFRAKVHGEELRLKEKESIYVVHVDSLAGFLGADNSRFLPPLTPAPLTR